MSQISRRDLAALAAGGAAAAAFVTSAEARQPNMERAIEQVKEGIIFAERR